MTFPVQETLATSNGSATTSPTYNLPSGITDGDLLLAFFANDFSVTATTFPAGWTQLHEGAPISSIRHALFYRVADGTEGASITLTTGNVPFSGVCVRISGHDSSTNAPTVTETTLSFGSIDPPNHTAGGGAIDYKWYAWAASDSTSSTFTPPTNYAEQADLNGNSAPSVSLADRDLNASSENPGTFTGGSGSWGAMTCSVFPGSEGGGGGDAFVAKVIIY